MSSFLSATSAEFLENYQRDTPVRWSPEDLAAQQGFVNRQVAGRDWLDWSTPAVALQLIQAKQTRISAGLREAYDAVVLAGPVVELLDLTALFLEAALSVRSGGRLVGIIPCLRDNSPESQGFVEAAARTLWPYHTAEELTERLQENGWGVDGSSSGFTAIARFNEAVLKSQLAFKGFNRIFAELAAEGYDPMKVGWGELRFAATVAR